MKRHYSSGVAQRNHQFATSGDDIGSNLIFERGDPVLEGQLLLFQTPQGEHVRALSILKRCDRIVQITMLAAEHFQLDPQDFELFHLCRLVHS